jgi:hypothetical protein
MTRRDAEPITTLVNEFFDSAGLTDSFLGQIAKDLFTRTLSKYVEKGKGERLGINIQLGAKFTRLSGRWTKHIFDDLSKLGVAENEKRLLLALFVASLVSQVMSLEQTGLETDIAEE